MCKTNLFHNFMIDMLHDIDLHMQLFNHLDKYYLFDLEYKKPVNVGTIAYPDVYYHIKKYIDQHMVVTDLQKYIGKFKWV